MSWLSLPVPSNLPDVPLVKVVGKWEGRGTVMQPLPLRYPLRILWLPQHAEKFLLVQLAMAAILAQGN